MKKLTLVFFIVLLSLAGLYAQKKNPELILEKGQTLTYSVTANIDMSQSMMGQEMQSQIVSTSKAVFSVEDIQQNQYIINQRVNDIEMRLKMQEMDTIMRLAEQGGFPTMVISKSGKVVDRHQPQENQTKGGFSPDMAGNASFMPFIEFPDYKVKKGESWNTAYIDTTRFSGGALISKVKTTYSYVGKEEKEGRKCVKISYKATIENEGSTSMQGMEFFIEGSGLITGIQWIDEKTGIMVADDANTENQMSLSLSGQQNFVIPVSMKSQISRVLR